MTEEFNPSPKGNPSLLKRRSKLETSVVKFIGRHTPKCREVVKILSDSLEQPLPLSMRFKLRVHYMICAWCQRYEKQLHQIRRFAGKLPEHIDQCSREQLPEDAKQRMKESLRKHRQP